MNIKPQKVLYILIFGIIATIISPLLFTRNLFLDDFNFTNTGQIGDTIGGITSPIVSLIGAILVFFALQAQIEANNLIQKQFNEQKKSELENKELIKISEYYKYFLKNVDDFSHESEKTIGSFEYKRKEIISHRGRIALKFYLNDIIRYGARDVHDSNKVLKDPKSSQFYSILKSLEMFIDILESSKISKDDKLFYKNIIHPLFESTLKPNKIDLENVNVICECGDKHVRFPSLFLETYNILDEKIERI